MRLPGASCRCFCWSCLMCNPISFFLTWSKLIWCNLPFLPLLNSIFFVCQTLQRINERIERADERIFVYFFSALKHFRAQAPFAKCSPKCIIPVNVHKALPHFPLKFQTILQHSTVAGLMQKNKKEIYIETNGPSENNINSKETF